MHAAKLSAMQLKPLYYHYLVNWLQAQFCTRWAAPASGTDKQGEYGVYTPPVRKIHNFLCTWFLSYLGLCIKPANTYMSQHNIQKQLEKKWQEYTLVNLILKKISKIGATRCQILRIKCTKIHFGWGSDPDPAELIALP